MVSEAANDSITVTENMPIYEENLRCYPVLISIGSSVLGGNLEPGQRLIPFEKGIEIGRQPQGNSAIRTVMLEDRWVSASHARIQTVKPGTYELVDLGSRNGTFLEGRAIHGPTLIADGSLFSIGSHLFVLRLLSAEELSAIEHERTRPMGPVATVSGKMATALGRLRRLAGTNEEVLLCGETGVGKEVYARAVHRLSKRTGTFVALNCAALPIELVESELFGFARGAHSQAASAKRGLIQDAEKGTLFLDEIGDMPLSAQSKLLRFLQDHTYTPLGSREVQTLDVRVLAATSSLKAGTTAPGLRRDLAARLGAEPVLLPPLYERREDLGSLAAYFLSQTDVVQFEHNAFLSLCLYSWPNNVRELEKVVREAALHAASEKQIKLVHLPKDIRRQLTPAKAEDSDITNRRSPRPRLSRTELEALLQRHQGNISAIASEQDRQWAVLHRWMKEYKLDPKEFQR
jgi:transcriptional regulator with PAS, ATPase and Fis domain